MKPLNPLQTSEELKSVESMREVLSGLADGECDAVDGAHVSAAWCDDAATRASWHGYQLIGDVMRSPALANTVAHDAAFLARLRASLANEPAIVAPQPLQPERSARRMQAWLVPTAIAAGFVAVAGVLVVSRMAAPGVDAPASLMAQAPGALAQRASVGAAPASGGLEVMDAALVRDAQIDSYLRAHREMRGSGLAALPGGALRSVDTIVPQR